MVLPAYAKGYKAEQLAYYLCKSPSCGGRSRHGLVSQVPWVKPAFGEISELTVTCLKCERVQKDAYNWDHA